MPFGLGSALRAKCIRHSLQADELFRFTSIDENNPPGIYGRSLPVVVLGPDVYVLDKLYGIQVEEISFFGGPADRIERRAAARFPAESSLGHLNGRESVFATGSTVVTVYVPSRWGGR